MPGYEPFLLCDFHVHTRWSDGNLTVREVIDLYGQTGLTGTAGAGQGDQPVGNEGLPHIVNLRAAADKTGELHR